MRFVCYLHEVGKGRAGALVGLGFLVVTLMTAPTQAQPRLTLSWDAPDGCPARDAVEGEVARLVGGTIPEGPPIAAEARTIAAEGAFELTLRTDVEGEHGERTLRADRCDELATAAALILALMIDPEAALRAEPEPSPLAPRASMARALSAPTRELEPPRTIEVRRGNRAAEPFTDAGPPVPTRDDGIEVLIGAGVQLDVGTLPSATAAVVVEGGFGVPLIDGRLRAVFLFPQSAASPELVGASAELMAFSAGVLACLRPIEEARAIGICADVSIGSVFGSSRGISNPAFGVGFWFGAGGGLALAWQPAPWFDVEGMAEILGQIAPSFDVIVGGAGGERTIVVYEPPPIAGRFTLAAHVHF